jgi:asparagine synthase (glutamine-hydrolysing)
VRLFICLLDLTNREIPTTVRRAYEGVPRSRGLEFHWQCLDHAAVLTGWDDPCGDPLTARRGDRFAVGMVRLDNRAEVERRLELGGRGLTDLELVLHAVTMHGIAYARQFLGDFAFVIWDATTRTAIAACDALRVKQLYHAHRNGLFAFASRGEALAPDNRYDVQYLAERVAQCTPSPELTVYAGVRQLPAATIATLEGGHLSTRQFWSPAEFETDPAWAKSPRESAHTCRQLLSEAVALRLVSVNGDTWSQLSGGLDSSSVVSIAQWLAETGRIAHGLAGTVTFVDRQRTASDEREYSNPVVERWSVRNHTIIDPPLWLDGDSAPPRLDQPMETLLCHPRERRLIAIVRNAGGRVLLTGIGGDELFTGTMFFFADQIAHGRLWSAVREMTYWAALGRVSLWQLAYRNALLPFMPPALQQRLFLDQGRVVPWISHHAVRQYGLKRRETVAATYVGRIGHKYHDAMVTGLTALCNSLNNCGFIGDSLEVRHPFLYRPLVEFALSLPPELCARPRARKWVLREAMRSILPETVRERVGKAHAMEVFAESLATQHRALEPLTREPILADLGVVDATKLRAAFDAAPRAPHGALHLHTRLQGTLAFEAWLQLRSDRWPRGCHPARQVR